eukprot:CAMPEP_0178555608 /NCGR_PEP_ID=MMETSP0697-20121206/8954_1 /TAXON_ID=265572 /ORGANISM="Extubocellulus spinifer, Strain CCMP396" /LENGTH=191 /DNA_ID=CAMNT_0020188629 /DNA_START=35 /DNA_END=606 /DNA_ORIENTATION=-
MGHSAGHGSSWQNTKRSVKKQQKLRRSCCIQPAATLPSNFINCVSTNQFAQKSRAVGSELHYPDRRGKRSSIVAEFPWVELSPDFTEEDAQWRPDKRESLQDVKVRASSFLSWLASNCQEETIGIVSHGVWIEVLLLRYCPEVLDNGQRRVYNCDIFKARCISVWEEKVDTVGTQEWNLLSVRLEGCEILG